MTEAVTSDELILCFLIVSETDARRSWITLASGWKANSYAHKAKVILRPNQALDSLAAHPKIVLLCDK